MATLAPMPSASDSTAAKLRTGVRRRDRNAVIRDWGLGISSVTDSLCSQGLYGIYACRTSRGKICADRRCDNNRYRGRDEHRRIVCIHFEKLRLGETLRPMRDQQSE